MCYFKAGQRSEKRDLNVKDGTMWKEIKYNYYFIK